jgi:hypothetical protein
VDFVLAYLDYLSHLNEDNNTRPVYVFFHSNIVCVSSFLNFIIWIMREEAYLQGYWEPVFWGYAQDSQNRIRRIITGTDTINVIPIRSRQFG